MRPVELWCEDEARLGLRPVTRRVWALKGCRPKSCGRQRFQSLYVYGFARPATGRQPVPVLAQGERRADGRGPGGVRAWADPEAKRGGAGGQRRRARGQGVRVPANVRLFRLPPCTPELQPAEHLWPLVREALANRDFDHLVGLAAKLRAGVDRMADHPEVVQGAVGFHWAVTL